MMYRLTLLGAVSLEGTTGPLSGRVVQRRQLALLALLGSSRGRPVTRGKVVGLLWAERPEAKARRFLSDTLYVIRDALGEEAVVEGPEGLRLNEGIVRSDVTAFKEAADEGRWHEAVGLYGGPFMDGFSVGWAGEFERWMEGERRRLASRHQDALEHLAEAAEAEGDWAGAVARWKERAGEEPTNSRVILRLMRAQAAAGNVPGALEHARVHELLLREELDLPVPDEVRALARELAERGGTVDEATVEPRAPSVEPAAPPRGSGDGAAAGKEAFGERDAPASREPGEAAPAFSRATFSGHPAGWIGVSLLLGIVLVGAYLGLAGPEPEAASADPEGADLDPDRVLVMTFENRTGEADLDPVGLMASDGITRALGGTGVLRGVPAEQILAAIGAEAVGEPHDAVDLEALARTARARTVVTGRFYARGDSLQFEARARDLVMDRTTHTFDPTTAPLSDPAPGLQPLQEQIAVALAMRADPTFAHFGGVAVRQPESIDAYRSFAQGMEHFHRSNFEDAVAHFEDVIEADPDFGEPYIFLAVGHWILGDHETADSIWAVLEERRDLLTDEQLLSARADRAGARRDYQRAYHLRREYAERVPGNEGRFLLGLRAIQVNRPAEAVEAFREFDPDLGLAPDWSPYWWNFGRALHMLGDHEEELEVGREAVERFPDDLPLIAGKLRALAALGRVDEVTRRLGEIMRKPWSDGVSPGDVARYAGGELRAHGHEEAANEAFTRALEWYDGRAGDEDWRAEIASTLYGSRRWEDARPLAEELAEEAPDDARRRGLAVFGPILEGGFLAPGFLGAVAARTDVRTEAEGILKELTDAEDATDAHFFWAARIASVLGEHDEAVALLERAFATGRPHGLDLHRTIDFEPLHDHPGFQELLEPDG